MWLRVMSSVSSWEFPQERFVQYEPSDEVWCRPLGIGRPKVSTIAYTVPNVRVTGVGNDGTIELRGHATPSFTWPIEYDAHRGATR